MAFVKRCGDVMGGPCAEIPGLVWPMRLINPFWNSRQMLKRARGQPRLAAKLRRLCFFAGKRYSTCRRGPGWFLSASRAHNASADVRISATELKEASLKRI